MKILEYQYKGENWFFSPTKFGKTNLIVGDSGTGKSRLLYTLFNLGNYVASGKVAGAGNWILKLETDSDIYDWEIELTKDKNETIIKREKILLNGEKLLDRQIGKTIFEGDVTPLLPNNQMAFSVLKENNTIKPIHQGFSTMMRRRFDRDALEKSTRYILSGKKALEKIGGKKDLFNLYKNDLTLNAKLYLLDKFFPKKYSIIIENFADTFPLIKDIKILQSNDIDFQIPNDIPIFCIKERGVESWLRLEELSSGMIKVLLILTDLMSLPSGGIYIIDEYENSLGRSAIDFLPNFLELEKPDLQLFITSHNIDMINRIPVDNWYLANRVGSTVTFKFGSELIQRYNISKHDKYFQLINDDDYYPGDSE